MPDPHNQLGPSPEELFAQLVREKREDLGWSQEELAKRVSAATGQPFHQTGITRIEKLGRGIRLNEALVLARVLGIELGPLAQDLDGARGEAEAALERALAAAETAAHEQDDTVYRLQIEMENISERHQRARDRLMETTHTVAQLRIQLEMLRESRAVKSDGDR